MGGCGFSTNMIHSNKRKQSTAELRTEALPSSSPQVLLLIIALNYLSWTQSHVLSSWLFFSPQTYLTKHQKRCSVVCILYIIAQADRIQQQPQVACHLDELLVTRGIKLTRPV